MHQYTSAKTINDTYKLTQALTFTSKQNPKQLCRYYIQDNNRTKDHDILSRIIPQWHLNRPEIKINSDNHNGIRGPHIVMQYTSVV